MKKIILVLTLILIFTCLFVVGVSAAEIKVEADSLDDIHTAIAGAQDNDSVIIDLTKDIAIPNTSSAIRVEGAKTVTINFNGYTIYANPGSAGAGTVYGMYINSNDAKLILNGTWDVDPVNYVEPDDEKISISNGEVNDPNEAAGKKSPDYASNGPAVYMVKGSLELNNMYINEYHTGEWAIFMMSSGVHDQDIKITNSIVRVPSSNTLYAVARRDSGGTQTSSLTQIEGSVIYGIGCNGGKESISFSEGSYIKNTRIATHKAYFDSYLDTAACPKEPVEIRNVIFENKNIYFWTGRYAVNFIDCTFPTDYTIEVKGDRVGDAKLIMTETATCEKAGRQAYVQAKQGDGNQKYIKSFDDLETVVEQYAIDNPALGHIIENPTGVHYDNYFEMGKCTGACKYCGTETAETNPSLPAFTTSKGFSTFNDNGVYSVTQGFTINKDVAAYFGEDFDYGILATVNAGATEIAPKLEDQNVVFASLCGSGFVATSIKLTNITDLEQKVVYCMYVKLGDNLVYLNNGTTSDTTAGLSYNDVESILSKK